MKVKIIILNTRLLIIRLISKTRKAQDTLIKLILIISKYDLTLNKKEYLRSLIKDKNLIIDELKSELSYFF